MTAGFLAANVPFLFRDPGEPSDPETPPPISPRCAGVTALRLVAQRRSCHVGKAHDHGYGTVSVPPHDPGMVVAELLKRQSGVTNRRQAPAKGRASPRSHGRSRPERGNRSRPRVLLASHCQPTVPECFGSCGNLAESGYPRATHATIRRV